MKSRNYLSKTPIACALALLAAAVPASAGSGRFKNGAYEFCVSVRFAATPAELQQIRDAFQNASQILSDATDGQHTFGLVMLVNDSGASQSAEYWIHAGDGRAYATQGNYGVRGQHVNLYFDSDFLGLNGVDGDAYTIAHEHAHHAYGILDEYSGPAGNADCAPPGSTCVPVGEMNVSGFAQPVEVVAIRRAGEPLSTHEHPPVPQTSG